MVSSPVSYFGGKTWLADRLAASLPAHKHYVETCGGSLAVLLAKRPSRQETVNDLNGHLMTFWRVLRNRTDDLERVCFLTPHSRTEIRREPQTGCDQRVFAIPQTGGLTCPLRDPERPLGTFTAQST